MQVTPSATPYIKNEYVLWVTASYAVRKIMGTGGAEGKGGAGGLERGGHEEGGLSTRAKCSARERSSQFRANSIYLYRKYVSG